MSPRSQSRTARQDNAQRSVLPGGVRLVTEHLPGRVSAHVGIFVGVGSRHETLRRHGASHMLEHALFKGTSRRSAAQISADVELLGGDLNAWTAREVTCFHARTLAADLPTALDVLLDIVTSPRLRAADLDSERAVILDEIAMHEDDPAERASDLALEMLFGADPLGRPVIGSEHSISAMSRDVIRRHWLRGYRPDQIVVAATGDVDHDHIADQVAAAVWPTTSEVPMPALTSPGHVTGAGELRAERSSLAQTSACLAWTGSGSTDARRHALALLTTVLGGGMSSRLFQRVREERGLVYSIDASDTSWLGAGLACVEWQALPARMPQVLDQVRAVLHDVAADGLSEAELEGAKHQIRGQTMLHHESPSALMTRLGTGWLAGDLRTVEEIVDDHECVSRNEVAVVAQDVLRVVPALAVAGAAAAPRKLERALAAW